MSYQSTVSSSLCRLVGLTSAQGKKINGSAAKINVNKTGVDDTSSSNARHPVCIDGVPSPMSIRLSNVGMFQLQASQGPKLRELSVGVGRGTLVDTTFQAALVENAAGQIIERAFVTGGAARTRGTIDVV